jgi:hypothetical protein
MSKDRIVLDWASLLGFDQADPKRLSPDYMATIGGKSVSTSLQAKVGDKNPPGVIGRPQGLGIAKH